MIKNLFLILALISLTSLSCRGDYVKNKFTIKSFSASFMDTTKEVVSIKFNVEYFSDSSERMGMAHKQMGMDGSNENIEYLNFRQPQNVQGNDGCITFDSFKKAFNMKIGEYKGQRLDFPQIFCTNKLERKNDELMLVLYNVKSKKVDTLYALITAFER